MSSKKKILIIQPIHTAGIKLLENNSDYEFEIVENTDYVLAKYRSNNKYQRNYIGDSIINSIGDILCCFIGFVIAYNYPKYSFPLLILSEFLLYLKMKDNLITNTIQIFVKI